MPPQKLWHGSKTPLEEASNHPDDVLACFRRLKQGPTLGELKERRRRMEAQLAGYIRACATKSAALVLSRSQADFAELEDLQRRMNDLKLQIIDVSEQIELFQQYQDSPSTELKAIVDLPQVIGIRAYTPQVIIITVVASISYNNREYLLGTWDIYFGELKGLLVDGKVLYPGKGDRSHYRVRRIRDNRVDEVGITYYNNKDGTFCFGTNYNAVNDMAKAREYLHTVQMMVTYMSSVGEHVRKGIPDKFRLLREGDLRQ